MKTKENDMSTIIYNHYHKKLDHDIAHIDDKGIVYNHSVHRAGYSCGHIGDGGRVYSHPKSKAGYCLGHVDEVGKIYNHPTSKTGHCVGHVDSNGVIYSHSNSELGYEVGHAEGPHFRQAAAIYLLMFYNQNSTAFKQEQQKPKSEEPSIQSEPSSEVPRQDNRRPETYNSGSSCGGVLFFIVAAVVVGLLDALRMLVLDHPGFILLFIHMGLIYMSPFRNRKLNDFNVSNKKREECLADAKSSSVYSLILPIILAVYSYFKTEPEHWGEYLMILIPVFGCWAFSFIQKYAKNLNEAELQESKKSSSPSSKKKTNTSTVPKTAPKTKPVSTSTSTSSSAKNNVTKPTIDKKTETKPVDDKVVIACPNCPTKLKIPAGRGKVKLRCQKCGTEIIANT